MSALVHTPATKHIHTRTATLYGVTTVPLKWILCNSDLTPKTAPNTTKQHEHPHRHEGWWLKHEEKSRNSFKPYGWIHLAVKLDYRAGRLQGDKIRPVTYSPIFRVYLCKSVDKKCGEIISIWQKSFSEAFFASLRKWEQELVVFAPQNYSGSWNLTHVLFGQWNIFNSSPSLNVQTPPSHSLAHSHIHICFHRVLPVK